MASLSGRASAAGHERLPETAGGLTGVDNRLLDEVRGPRAAGGGGAPGAGGRGHWRGMTGWLACSTAWSLMCRAAVPRFPIGSTAC